MAYQYKIGDKVILKSSVTSDRVYNGVTLSAHIYKDLENTIKINGFLTITAYGTSKDVVCVKTDSINWRIGEDALELYQEKPHIYKVGDKVRIKKREGSSSEYPFTFTIDMAKLAEKVFVIKQIINCSISSGIKYYNGDDHKYYLKTDDGYNWEWHSSMFEPVLEDHKSEICISLKEGDLILICDMLGKISISSHNYYYLAFSNTSCQEHLACCKKLRELVPNFDKIANKFDVICNTDGRLFPEFSTINNLEKFAQAVNNAYNFKKSITNSKISNENEIRFQKPKTSSIRGSVPTGRAICGRRYQTAVKLGHLSNTTCYC